MGTIDTIKKYIENNSMEKSWNLSGNNIDSDGARLISDALLKNNTLEELILNSCGQF